MADAVIESPPAQAQDLGRTPTLLETLAAQTDISGAPVIRPRELPHIAEEKSDTKKEKAEKPKKEEKSTEKPPEETAEAKTKRETAEKTQNEEWKKAGETVAEKLFKKRAPKAGDKPAEKPVEAKADDGKLKDKKEDEPPPKPAPRKRASEAEITERAAAAAAEAATRAVARMAPAPKPEERPAPKLPEDNLTPAERKQFTVYQELESSQPDRYKGVTAKYLNSLTEIQTYVKTWAKDNPGAKFDPDDEQHNDFFARVEPDVDEDDWVDAKANLRAREISNQAVKPLNEKLQQMEQDRNKAMLEPFVQQKTLEGVHLLLNEFDPELAAEILKPDGLKELKEKDPITAGILNHVANHVGALAAEIVRLHDPNAGTQFDPRNPSHKEIADFILSQEDRISRLPANDRLRDGKRFIGRLAYRQLQPDEKAGYWFLDQDDITYLLAQKFALDAKKIRDAEVEKFNATAEKLGYKKIDGAKPAAKAADKKPAEQPKPKETVTSPEAVSRTSLKTATGNDGKAAPGEAEVILGGLFQRLRS